LREVDEEAVSHSFWKEEGKTREAFGAFLEVSALDTTAAVELSVCGTGE
jgi:hypothetical protein